MTDRIGIGVLTRLIDRDLVDDVLAETGRVEQRSRLLPARVVVYYVLGLCLFFGDAYEEVMRLLVTGLHFTGAWQEDWQVPTTGAIAQARQRLGAAPSRVLFERVAVPCAQHGTKGAWLGSRRLMAIDGFVLDIPDTKENDAAFGRSGGEKNPAPFPQVRVVGLGECGTHAIVAARLAAWRVSERALARDLTGELGPGMLVIADRGFCSYRLWQAAAASGADLLWRMQSGQAARPPASATPDPIRRVTIAGIIYCVGGVLSPLLANIALSALDDHFSRQWHQEMGSDGQRRKRRQNGQGNWKIIRYADDFVLMVHGERRHAEALREEVAAVLAPMGLRLAPEKTAVVHLDEGFTFLGFDIRRMRKRGTQKYCVCTKPSKKAIQAIKDKVRTKTYRSTRHMGLDELIASLNRSLAGWADYFRHGVSKAVFSDVDSHAWNRLMRWIRAKYKHGSHRIGMPELRRRFCDQGWRFACNGVVFTGASSVAVTRYRYRGSTIPTPWTPAPAPR